MVNLKAGGHQGERKRAQAGAEEAVSKAEKLSLRSKDGDGSVLPVVNADGVPLRVVAREKALGEESNVHLKSALVDDETIRLLSGGRASASRVLLCRPGGDMVLSARRHDAAGRGQILLSEAQRLSLHVCEDEPYEWVPFRPPAEDPALAMVIVEAQLLEPPLEGAAPLEVEASALGRAVSKWFFDEVISDNEIFIASFASTKLVLRVVGLSRPDTHADADADDPAGALASAESHCYRGVVSPQTSVYVRPSTRFKSSSSQRRVTEGLRLLTVVSPPSRPMRHAVNVLTSDGEIFPVHRQLLRPCIALTKAVRDRPAADEAPADAPAEVSVDVDCATFDRVLLFLEASARGDSEQFGFDMHALEPLAHAARVLGCRALLECTQRRLGDFESRIRMHRWEDVVKHNRSGGCFVTMDGMVFDLEAWLPHHPGGPSIIPEQALNKDCAVFFELYHASRESFTYLKEFYIGEIVAEDVPRVPLEEETASADFMLQLREFSAPFRYRPDPLVKGNHLGVHA